MSWKPGHSGIVQELENKSMDQDRNLRNTQVSGHSIYSKDRITNQWENNDCSLNGAWKIDYLYRKNKIGSQMG